jgi:hypothetical protein
MMAMARIRTIKPELARHEGLFELERASGLPMRLVWALLPMICDREGLFKWRPRALKCDILPYDELDFAHVLDALVEAGFLVKYRVGDDWYGAVPTFSKHQFVNAREQDSSLPAPDAADETVTRAARVAHASVNWNSPARGEGKGREQEGNRKGTEVQLGAVNGSKPAARPTETRLVIGNGLFETFWSAYPKKVGKLAAKRAWEKLQPSDALADEMLAALKWQVQQDAWRREAGRFIPNPATWLNAGRWDDQPNTTPRVSERTLAVARAGEEFLKS